MTVASQFSSRDVPGWISLIIAGFALVTLAIGAGLFVLVLLPPRTVRGAPQVIRVLLTPGVADTDPGALSLQLAGTLADEMDFARKETEWMNRKTLIGIRWLAAGVLGVFLLAGLYGVTHDVPTVQRVRLVAPLNARVIAPVQARIAAPVQARILAPLHVRIVGPVGAKIETPVS